MRDKSGEAMAVSELNTLDDDYFPGGANPSIRLKKQNDAF